MPVNEGQCYGGLRSDYMGQYWPNVCVCEKTTSTSIGLVVTNTSNLLMDGMKKSRKLKKNALIFIKILKQM